MVDIIEIPKDEFRDFASSEFYENLQRMQGTYHRNFKLVRDEYLKKKKKNKIFNIIILVFGGLLFLIDTLIMDVSLWLIYAFLIGLFITRSQKLYNENDKFEKYIYLLEEKVKKEEDIKIRSDSVLFQYYSEFDDINSKEAQEYAIKNKIYGTFRSKSSSDKRKKKFSNKR